MAFNVSLCIRITLNVFPKLPFIRIPNDNTSVLRPRGRSDVFYAPMTQNPYLSCLNSPITFPPFHNRLASPKKHICAHVLVRPYPSDSNKAIFVFHSITTHAGQLPAPTLPAHLLSSSTRSLLYLSHSLQSSLNTFWSNQLLVLCSTIVISYYSNSHELVTIVAVVIC
ncbi:hypothetical protein ACTXT7_003697 [Hymenolepis weldensis]